MEAMVGGIEDGPAARAGVHWGDAVLTVNGKPTASQSASELERLLSSTRPKVMQH
jgi:C-terminal processing protease CtpA/Prc